MGIVSTNKGDFTFQSADDILKFVQTLAQEKSEIWISGQQPYPCLSVSSMGNMPPSIFSKTTQAKCGCLIMIKIGKKLPLLQAGKNGDQMPVQLSI